MAPCSLFVDVAARAARAGGKGIVVVTEDYELRGDVEDEGGRVMDITELQDRLRRGKRKITHVLWHG